MLIIRSEQMKVLEEAALRSYEDEMVQHIKQFTPRHSEIIGEQAVHQVVRMGIDRAKEYGLTNRGPVRSYIEMMFMFGSAFDTDPQVPWAGEILNRQDLIDQMHRAEVLYGRTIDYVTRVNGPGNAYLIKALLRILAFLRRQFSFSPADFELQLLKELTAIYPEKKAYIGDEAIMVLVGEGVERAYQYSFVTVPVITLFAVMMFLLGHGMADDPLYPWVSAIVRAAEPSDPAQRARYLEEKVVAYIENILSQLEEG